jgi:pimeloyl-ACP methyl ester carboxylesterase
MEMKTIQAIGSTLTYERLGAGIPLVLIHGFPLDRSIWKDVTPLLESNFDLILPDLRGFGKSVAGTSVWTMNDLAEDITCLLDHLGIESAYLAGHSMGGYVALAFAKMHPRRVRGLALVASQTAADAPEKQEDRLAQAKRIGSEGISETAAGMTTKLSADVRIQGIVRELMLKQEPAGFIGSLHAMAGREDTLSVLTGSAFPVILIHGDADSLIPVQRARDIQVAVPRARLFLIPGSGHMPMMEAPQKVAEGLASFQ